jgi:hypothetical protein
LPLTVLKGKDIAASSVTKMPATGDHDGLTPDTSSE